MKILQEGLALLGIDYLGGHGSRGYGRVNISLDDVKPVGNRAKHYYLLASHHQ